MELLKDSFEEAFVYHNDEGQLMVPPRWIPMWIEGDTPSGDIRPEFRPEFDRVRTGKQAAKWATRHNTHDAVLARTIALQGSGLVTLTAYGAAWQIKAGQALRVGINATGSGEWKDSEIQWSEWFGQDQPEWEPETYYRYQVSAVPASNQVTVFLHSKARFAMQNVVAYWDDVLVEQDEEDTSPPVGEIDYERIRGIVRSEVHQAIENIMLFVQDVE